MTKNSKFVKASYLDKELPPIGTQTERGKIIAYNANKSISFSNGTIAFTITGTSHQDTLEIRNIKLLKCKKNAKWIK